MRADEQLHYIMVEVANGRGNHGDFLRSFADAMVRADAGNLSILREAAWKLVDKYGLEKYLQPDEVSRG